MFFSQALQLYLFIESQIIFFIVTVNYSHEKTITKNDLHIVIF